MPEIETLGTALIRGRFIAGVQDGLDPGTEPDTVPLVGLKIVVEPLTRVLTIPASVPGGRSTTMILPIQELTTNSDGLLYNPDQGDTEPDVKIVASNALSDVPDRYIRYRATISATDTGVEPLVKTFFALAGTTVDLPTVEQVPDTPVINLTEWTILVADARAAKDIAVMAASASSGSAGASAGSAAAAAASALESENWAKGFGMGTTTGLAAGATPTASITGPAGSAKLNLGIPKGDKGDKGDPGGLVFTDLTPNTDLNTVNTPGMYRIVAGASATNFPKNPVATGTTWTIEVLESVPNAVPANSVFLQRATQLSGTAANDVRLFWVRRHNAGVFSEWRTYSYTKIDKTSGFAVVSVLDQDTNSEIAIAGPGGLTNAPIIPADTNLDTLVLDGNYRQSTSANASLALNYPVASSGHLNVTQISGTNSLIQQYVALLGGTTGGRNIWVRTRNGGTWSPWRTFASTSIDKTFGFPIVSVWDESTSTALAISGPGGWVQGYLLPATTDPDTLINTGVYTYETLSTHAAKMPPNQTSGIIEVLSRRAANDRVFQRLTANGTVNGKYFWERFYTGSAWTPWELFSSVKIDKTSGYPQISIVDPANGADLGVSGPGGITNAILLSSADNLNSVQTPGLYYWTNTSLPANSPTAYSSEMLVIGRVGSVSQEVSTRSSTALSSAFYKRAMVNSAFIPWKTFTSTRTDQTAGRAMYAWDEINNREQLVNGDTGWRDISALLENGWTGSVRVRRFNGYLVELLVDNLAGGSAGNFMNLPLGFFNNVVAERPLFHLADANSSPRRMYITPAGIWQNSTGSLTGGIYGKHLFTTNSPWPTTLPGTPVGGIPSL